MENVLGFVIETVQIGLEMFSLVCIGMALTFLYRMKKSDKEKQKLKDERLETARRNAKC